MSLAARERRAVLRGMWLGGVFLLACGLAPCALAAGGPPMLSDDPGTVAPHHWEINLSFRYEVLQDEKNYEAPRFDAAYGLTGNLHFKFEIPYAIVDPNDGRAQGDRGNGNVGFKWRYFGDAEHGWSASTFPQLEIRGVHSAVRKGVAEKGNTLALPLEASWVHEAFSVDLEAGYLMREFEKDGLEYGTIFAYEVTEKVQVLGEFHGESNVDFRKENDWRLNFGVVYKAHKNINILNSVGVGLPGSTNRSKVFGYLALQFVF